MWKMNMRTLFTDGSALGNPGPGGWGAVAKETSGKRRYEWSGYEAQTTNNRMELQAVISGLQKLFEVLTDKVMESHGVHDENTHLGGLFAGPKTLHDDIVQEPVSVVTDSTYVQKGITERLKRRKKNNRRTAARQPVKNQDLRRKLDSIVQYYASLSWKRTKGHAGHPENEYVDKLARNQALHGGR